MSVRSVDDQQDALWGALLFAQLTITTGGLWLTRAGFSGIAVFGFSTCSALR
jgi:hypothetical protein